MLRPLRAVLKRINLSERLSTRLCDSFLELRLEHIDKKLVKEGSQCAHRNPRVMRNNISESLEE